MVTRKRGGEEEGHVRSHAKCGPNRFSHFIGNKQTKKQTDKQNIYIDKQRSTI